VAPNDARVAAAALAVTGSSKARLPLVTPLTVDPLDTLRHE
jgi:hypothetical protein